MRTSLPVLVLVAAVGCGPSTGQADMGDMSISAMVPTNFDSLNTFILQPTCTGHGNFSVCHTPAGKSSANELDLTNDPYNALVGQMAQNKKAKGMGLLRVKPCDAADSFLVMKVEMTTDLDKDSDFGHHMPDVAGEFLTPAQVQGIKDWINRGALKDEPASVSGAACTLYKDMGPAVD